MKLLGVHKLFGSKRIMAVLLSAALAAGGASGTSVFAEELSEPAVETEEAAVSDAVIESEGATVSDAAVETAGAAASERNEASVDSEDSDIAASAYSEEDWVVPTFSKEDAPLVELNTTTYLQGMKGYSRNGNNYYYVKFEIPDQESDPGCFNIEFYKPNDELGFGYVLLNQVQNTIYNFSYVYYQTHHKSENFGFKGQTMYLKIDPVRIYDGEYKIRVNYITDNNFEAESNDTTEEAESLEVGKKKQGQLHSSKDVDFYKIKVPRRGSYTAHFYHENGDSTTGWETTVFNEEKNTLASFVATKSGDTTCDSLSLEPGTYYIKINSYGWFFTGNARQPYFISLEEGVGGDQYAGSVSANRGDYSITYNSEIRFWGNTKKFKNESEINKVFGDVIVTWNGTAYKATSIKVVKKHGNNYIQILKTEKGDKSFDKALKKLTKGTTGLQFTIKPLKVTKSMVTTKEKLGKLRKVLITTNGPKTYKAKKGRDYKLSGRVITFSGKNLEGTYTY